jgi:hypothetical protein
MTTVIADEPKKQISFIATSPKSSTPEIAASRLRRTADSASQSNNLWAYSEKTTFAYPSNIEVSKSLAPWITLRT